MKRIIRSLALIFIFAFVLTLFGCDKSAKGNLEDFINKYDDATVFEKIPLITKDEKGNKITWTSSDESVLSSDGEVKVDLSQNGGIGSDGEIKVVELTASVTVKGETTELKMRVYVATEAAYSLYSVYQGLITEYNGKELSGYDIDITAAGNPLYKYTFTSSETYSVSYTNTTHLAFDADKVTATVTRPAKDECITDKNYIIEQLPVTIVDSRNNLTLNGQIPVMISYDSYKYTTLSNLRAEMAAEGFKGKQDTYVFKGYVTIVWESEAAYQGFYVQDGATPLYVYSCPVGDATPVVAEGDLVLVTATVTNYNGLAETDKVSAVKILKKAEQTATEFAQLPSLAITTSNYNAEDLKGHDGQMASVDTLVYESGTMVKSTSAILNFLLSDMVTPVIVRVDKYTSDFDAIMEIVNSLEFGDKLTVTKCAIGWNNDPQLCFTNAKYLTKQAESATDQELLTYDVHKKAFGPKASYNSGETAQLLTETSGGGAVSWELITEEGDEELITLGEDNKLTLATFYAPFTFTLKATITYGTGEDEISDVVEFEVNAVSPSSTLTEAKAGLADNSFQQGSLVEFYVADIVGDIYYVSDGVTFAKATLEENVELTAHTHVKATVDNLKVENGILSLNVLSVPIHDTTAYVAGLVKELGELANELAKVQLKSVTIAEGKAQVGETLEVAFKDAEGAAYADGEYTNLVGYVVPVDDTHMNFIVLEKMYTIREAQGLPSKVLSNDAYVNTPVTVMGKLIGLNSASSMIIADSEGNVIQANTTNAAADIKIGDYMYFSTTVGNNYGIVQLYRSTPIKVVNYQDKFDTATLESKVAEARVITLDADTDPDDYEITSNRKHNTLPEGETNYSYYGYNVLYKVTGTVKITSGYVNIGFGDPEGTDRLSLNSYNAFGEKELLDEEFFNDLIEKGVIVLNSSNKYDAGEHLSEFTITVVIVDNFYVSNGNTLLGGYLLPGLTSVSAVVAAAE